ncbi:MAG: hypothetical protein KDA44_11960 [Planctomycetales bacterium]|nr:hypothetical protein [Planctomycetales bacterium]
MNDGFALHSLLVAQLNANDIINIATRALHVLAAIILGGGLFYMKAVLAPKGADACFADRRAIWAKWVGVATFLLLATGFYNFMVIREASKADGGAGLPSTYHALFGVKVLLGLGVMFIASILAGKTAAADKFRANIGKWLAFGWMAVVAIVVIAAVLRTLH